MAKGETGGREQTEAFLLSDIPIYTGVPRPEVEKWIEKGWVRPSLEKGEAPAFTRTDLYHIGFLKKVKESGFSRDLAVEKINVYAVSRAAFSGAAQGPVGIAFSRSETEGKTIQGAWIISEALDRETGWDSLDLIGKRLKEGADDFYILNFNRLARRIDALIDQARGR